MHWLVYLVVSITLSLIFVLWYHDYFDKDNIYMSTQTQRFFAFVEFRGKYHHVGPEFSRIKKRALGLVNLMNVNEAGLFFDDPTQVKD